MLMSQAFNARFGRRLCGVLAVAALIFASLLLPSQLEQMRTGHWEIEHFFAYLVAVPLICLGWPRPFLVASTLIPAAALLEVLQCLRPDHSPNLFAALSSIAGVMVGTLLTVLISRLSELQAGKRRSLSNPSAEPNVTEET
jgi:glucose-6-phosphate-specific signal transduction histidine kinase